MIYTNYLNVIFNIGVSLRCVCACAHTIAIQEISPTHSLVEQGCGWVFELRILVLSNVSVCHEGHAFSLSCLSSL